jgi:hypothetical protein
MIYCGLIHVRVDEVIALIKESSKERERSLGSVDSDKLRSGSFNKTPVFALTPSVSSVFMCVCVSDERRLTIIPLILPITSILPPVKPLVKSERRRLNSTGTIYIETKMACQVGFVLVVMIMLMCV